MLNVDHVQVAALVLRGQDAGLEPPVFRRRDAFLRQRQAHPEAARLSVVLEPLRHGGLRVDGVHLQLHRRRCAHQPPDRQRRLHDAALLLHRQFGVVPVDLPVHGQYIQHRLRRSVQPCVDLALVGVVQRLPQGQPQGLGQGDHPFLSRQHPRKAVCNAGLTQTFNHPQALRRSRCACSASGAAFSRSRCPPGPPASRAWLPLRGPGTQARSG